MIKKLIVFGSVFLCTSVSAQTVRVYNAMPNLSTNDTMTISEWPVCKSSIPAVAIDEDSVLYTIEVKYKDKYGEKTNLIFNGYAVYRKKKIVEILNFRKEPAKIPKGGRIYLYKYPSPTFYQNIDSIK
jgi:hypothetical protein